MLIFSACISALKYKNAFQGDKSPSEVGVLINLHRGKSTRNAFEKSFHIVLFKNLKSYN